MHPEKRVGTLIIKAGANTGPEINRRYFIITHKKFIRPFFPGNIEASFFYSPCALSRFNFETLRILSLFYARLSDILPP